MGTWYVDPPTLRAFTSTWGVTFFTAFSKIRIGFSSVFEVIISELISFWIPLFFDEVVKNLTGFGVRKQDPAQAMRFKMGQYAGEILRARNAWTLDIVNASNIQKDIEAVAAGNKPITIATEFENLQSNNYRVMSKLYKDVKHLSILNFSKKAIKELEIGVEIYVKKMLKLVIQKKVLIQKNLEAH